MSSTVFLISKILIFIDYLLIINKFWILLAISFIFLTLIYAIDLKNYFNFTNPFKINSTNTNSNVSFSYLKYYLKNFQINKISFILLAFFASLIGFFSTIFYEKYYQLSFFPSSAFFLMIYITLLEILIGNNKNNISLDSSSLKLTTINKSINIWNKFKFTLIFSITNLVIYLEFFSMIGNIFYTNNFKDFFRNLIIMIVTFFSGFIYFRKVELLINDNYSKTMNFSLTLIIFTISTLLVTLK
jgi:hypothetical protein